MPREITYREAVREAMVGAMREDPEVFLMGEDVGVYGGAFGVSRGMVEEFGEERVVDTPVSEAGYVGLCTGAALMGMRPIAEIQFSDFMTHCMDQLVNQAAKKRYMFGGEGRVPMVVRTPGGAGTGAAAQHSQSLEAWFVHTPGLKVVMPSTPYDAKGLLLSAIDDPNTVIFYENKLLYNKKGEVPEEPYRVPIGEARVSREGGLAVPARPPNPESSPDDEGFVREPLSSVRRVGAERTARSFAEVPHFYLTRELEVDRLLELRERLKAKMDPAPSLTDLLALAVARTLKDHPRLNARYLEGGAMRVNPRVNLGVATATERGLVVPVLKGADTLALRELVPAARDAVGRAREGKLGPDDLAGGTFTVSNLGMMGIDAFDAIINAPQAAILALGRVRTVPEWREGEWMPLRVISATLSVDHRVADGARFLADLQSALLDWELLL